MNALTSREEQFIVNTVQEENGTSTEESVNVRLKRTGLGSDSPKFSASGHVETGGQDIPLDMYYRDGMLYSISGNAKVRSSRATRHQSLQWIPWRVSESAEARVHRFY